MNIQEYMNLVDAKGTIRGKVIPKLYEVVDGCRHNEWEIKESPKLCKKDIETYYVDLIKSTRKEMDRLTKEVKKSQVSYEDYSEYDDYEDYLEQLTHMLDLLHQCTEVELYTGERVKGGKVLGLVQVDAPEITEDVTYIYDVYSGMAEVIYSNTEKLHVKL